MLQKVHPFVEDRFEFPDVFVEPAEFQKNFTTSLSHIRIASDFKLAFIKIKALTVQECCDLYDPEVWTAKEEETEVVEEVVSVEETVAVEDAIETDEEKKEE